MAPNQQASKHFSKEKERELRIRYKLLVCKWNISAAKREWFVSHRMTYITLRYRSCNISVLHVHVPTEYKTDDVKDSSYVSLEPVLHKFPTCHKKICCEISMPK
jgi:hypothetical protein